MLWCRWANAFKASHTGALFWSAYIFNIQRPLFYLCVFEQKGINRKILLRSWWGFSLFSLVYRGGMGKQCSSNRSGCDTGWRRRRIPWGENYKCLNGFRGGTCLELHESASWLQEGEEVWQERTSLHPLHHPCFVQNYTKIMSET